MKSIIRFIKETLGADKQVTVYLMCGLPGAGKSTWIKNNLPNNINVVSRDIIRSEMGLTKSADEKAVGTFTQERLITQREDELIDKNVNFGRDFVIDDTNVNQKYRKALIKKLKEKGCKIIGVNFNTPVETCIKRRDGQIPPDVIQKMAQKLTPISSNDADEIIEVK